VWLSFGPAIEHVLNSPAQHQIHHSDAPRHFDRNFGVNLSLWDWMFGTLYVTTSKPESLQFGIAGQGPERYHTLGDLIVMPFREIASKIGTLRPWAQTRRLRQLVMNWTQPPRLWHRQIKTLCNDQDKNQWRRGTRSAPRYRWQR
jgi:hypothetical protein